MELWEKLCSEPVRLYGPGQYGLINVKEQRVTADFMNLKVEDRGCQDVETRENCITNNYLTQLRLKCGCLPPRLNIHGKVGQSRVRALAAESFDAGSRLLWRKSEVR